MSSAVSFTEPRLDDSIQRLLYKIALVLAGSGSGSCAMQSGAGSPVGTTTPDFVGQLFYDTSANAYYRSTGLTSADWVLISSTPTPTVVWAPATEGATWDDAGGAGQTGNYATFLANADLTTLSYLNLDATAITSLSCKNCPELVNIQANNCSGPFVTLETVNLAKLITLAAAYSALTGIDVLTCPALEFLNVSYSSLASLDVSGNAGLIDLNFSYTPVAAIDLSNNINLFYLTCPGTGLVSLDVSSCPRLLSLIANNNPSLATVTLTGCSQVANITLSQTIITALDVSTCSGLLVFNADYTLLTALDFSGLSFLEVVQCSYNPTLATLMFLNNPAVKQVSCLYATIVTLNLGVIPNLEQLDVSFTGLPILDVFDNRKLVTLNAHDGAITAVSNLNRCPFIATVRVQNNPALGQANVDDILCDVDASGALAGALDITGTSVPSAAGLVCSASLDPGKGWTVTHD